MAVTPFPNKSRHLDVSGSCDAGHLKLNNGPVRRRGSAPEIYRSRPRAFDPVGWAAVRDTSFTRAHKVEPDRVRLRLPDDHPGVVAQDYCARATDWISRRQIEPGQGKRVVVVRIIITYPSSCRRSMWRAPSLLSGRLPTTTTFASFFGRAAREFQKQNVALKKCFGYCLRRDAILR